MLQEPLRLALIIGSNREARFGEVVGDWFAGVAKGRGDLTVDVIDLADHELPTVLSQNPSPRVAAELEKVSPRLAEADASVVVTPEYNHSYPAALKNLIDWHHTQWQAKPVGFVSYGGLSGGLRSVEHLRPVFAELHAVTVRDVVSLHMAWERFGPDGAPKDEGPVQAAKVLLDQLVWWGNALREARAKTPYGM
ncbi:NADPH-dependent oxidoreductase [Streptomyces griseoluteus]|uniref:NADPH-dependent oxidoreductase n=1 Tax=Streptomyces griseoluteus TaxID=29306 RepID=A0A4Z1DHL3_STRGP|nr:NAD(P)H-dependent oxidoreductase [Streptomyces griseoluteus]TGN82345.1 NADPH-dependent oxidoreductase [Streptomyces griseoluteus]GHF10193.1 FMN reductase [Streptomyces griseoluteus]